MDESAVAAQPAPVSLSASELAAALPAVRSAARWFWWIAGLSLVNIFMLQTGSETSFVMGLGITAMSDAVFASNKLIGFGIDASVLAFFALLGLLAQRGQLWAFYMGTAVYALDALIYVRFEDWMPAGFHALAIFFIVKGVMVLREALKKTTGQR